MRRRRLLLGAGALAVLGLGCSLALWLTAPREPVCPATFRRIDVGMTEAQVERIIGRSADDGATWRRQITSGDFYTIQERRPGSWSGKRVAVAPGATSATKGWMSADQERLIQVRFLIQDRFSSGRVASALYRTARHEETFLDRLRRLLPW